MGKNREKKIDLDGAQQDVPQSEGRDTKSLIEGTSDFTHRPFIIKVYGLLSAAVLAVLFIGILEIIAHKFPQASKPYHPAAVPSASNSANATTTPQAVRKRETQIRFAAVAPANGCGFTSDLSTACLATKCMEQEDTTVEQCADLCTKLGIWPFEAKTLCPRQTNCGYTNALNDNCRNYCYANEQGNPFSATDPVCANYCQAHEMQPYQTIACGSTPVGTPAGTPTSTPNPSPTPNNSPTPNGSTPSVVVSLAPNRGVEVPPSSIIVANSVAAPSQAAPSPVAPSVPMSVAPPAASIAPAPSLVAPSPDPPASLAPSPAPVIVQSVLAPSVPVASVPASVIPAASVPVSVVPAASIPASVAPAASVPASIALADSLVPSIAPAASDPASVAPAASAPVSVAPGSIPASMPAASIPALVESAPVSIGPSAALPVSVNPSAVVPVSNNPSAAAQSVAAPSNLFASAPPQLLASNGPSAVPVNPASVVPASANPLAVTVPPDVAKASIVPVVPVIQPPNSVPAQDPLGKTNLAQPVNVPVNPANAPLTVAVLPNAAGSPSTVVINNPSLVLPLMGLQTVASSVVFTNANGQVITQSVTGFTSLPDSLSAPANALVTSHSSIVVTDAQGHVSTVPVDVISPAKSTNAPVIAVQSPDSPGSDSSGDGAGGGSGVDASGQSDIQKSSFTIVSTSKTFAAGYLPILLARVAHWTWSAVHGQLSAYEPFAQMARAGGASGSVLLGPSFSSMWSSFVAYGAVVVITPLAPELLTFDASYCSNPNANDAINPCFPAKVATNIPIIRTIEALLALIAVMAIVTAIRNSKKPSGITADPTCIVAVASMMHHPQVVKDFQGVSGEATESDLKRFLETKKYKLGTYVSENGSERYGIIPALHGDARDFLDLGATQGSDRTTSEVDGAESKSSALRMWKAVSTYLDGVFLLFIVAVMCIAASYVKWVDRSALARMFQFSNVGRRIIFTCIGLVVSSNWGRLLSDTQTVSPYFTLARQDAPARRSILIPKHNTALTSVIPALHRGQNTTFVVAFTALMAEFLVVALSGFPIRPGSTRDEFFFCGISTLVILAVMVLVLVVVNFWRRALPHLPRKPDSTGSVMTYLAESRMLKDFEGIERMKTKDRDHWIETLGNHYEYATKRTSATGQEKWVVDASSKLDDVESGTGMSTPSIRNPVVHTSMLPMDDARYGIGHAAPLAPLQFSGRTSPISVFDHSD